MTDTANTSSANTRNVGVIGVGQTGAGIARNLDKAELLSGIFDISDSLMSSQQLSNEVILGPLDEVSAKSDLLVILPNAS